MNTSYPFQLFFGGSPKSGRTMPNGREGKLSGKRKEKKRKIERREGKEGSKVGDSPHKKSVWICTVLKRWDRTIA